MKAVVMSDYGTNDVLKVAELPIPQPGPTEVLVRIHATGLNPVDFKIREGHLKELFPVEFPRVLGGDISGVVVDVGALAKDFKKGDAVYFSNPLDRDGGFAEFVTVDQSIVALKPKTLNHIEAASLPVVGLTSVQALRDFAGVKKGDRVLIHAGAGGVPRRGADPGTGGGRAAADCRGRAGSYGTVAGWTGRIDRERRGPAPEAAAWTARRPAPSRCRGAAESGG